MMKTGCNSSSLKWINNKKLFFSLMLFLPLLLFSSAKAAPAKSISNELPSILLKLGYIEVPLQMADTQKTLLVHVSFDGKNDYLFIVDTGAVHTYVDEKLVKKYNFQQGADSIMTGGGEGDSRKSYSYLIPNFQINSLISHNIIAYAQDHSFIKIFHHTIMGILGLNFLRDHAAVIDVVNKRLYLKSDNAPLALSTLEQLKSLGYKSFNLEIAPSGHPTILVQINNDVPKTFLFDTGVPVTLLAQDYVKELGLKHLSKVTKENGSGGGEIKVYKTHIKNVTVGSINWYPGNIGVINFEYIQVGAPLYGVLGLDWMQTNRSIIAMANNLVLAK